MRRTLALGDCFLTASTVSERLCARSCGFELILFSFFEDSTSLFISAELLMGNRFALGFDQDALAFALILIDAHLKVESSFCSSAEFAIA